MLELFLNYINSVNPKLVVITAASMLLLLLSGLILSLSGSGGYYKKIKKAVKNTDKFICKNLMIRKENEAQYFTECLSGLPAEYRRSWRAYVARGTGIAGDCFPPETYTTALCNVETQIGTLVYLVFALAVILLNAAYFFFTTSPFRFSAAVIVAESAIVFLSVANYKLKRLRAVKKTPMKMEELAVLLNRFVNIKPVSEQTILKGAIYSCEKTDEKSAEAAV